MRTYLWIGACALLGAAGCGRMHGADVGTCDESAEAGDPCEGTWSCTDSIEGSTGTHFTERTCVEGSVVWRTWTEPAWTPPDAAAPADATAPVDGGQPAADAGSPGLCEQLCASGCGTPFGDGPACVVQCEQRSAMCHAAELEALGACRGLCDSLYPCIADVSCLFAPPDNVPCGASSCELGAELCVGCTAWVDEEARVSSQCEARGEEDFFTAIWTHTCPDADAHANVFVECRRSADCRDGQVCVVTSGEGGYAYCYAPTSPDDFAGSRGCLGPADCPAERPACVPHEGFGYFEPFEASFGWRPHVCAE